MRGLSGGLGCILAAIAPVLLVGALFDRMIAAIS